MAKLQRNCGFYPSGEEPTNVWGLFPAGTADKAPLCIPPGALITTPIPGVIVTDNTRLYVYLNNAWQTFVKLSGDTMTGPLLAVAFQSKDYDVAFQPLNDIWGHIRNKLNTEYRGLAAAKLYISEINQYIQAADGKIWTAGNDGHGTGLDADLLDGQHLSAVILTSLVTAKGDLIVATANATPARLAVGSNKQLLMADSTQTAGIKWANPNADSIAFTATDRLLGRASAGAGAGEEIVCTAAGRALLDDASAAAQRTTLGLIDDVTILAPGAAVIWTDQPADLTELLGLTIHRTKFDLTAASQARLLVNVAAAGATGAKLAAQYSTDQNTWYYLDGSSGPAAGIDSAGLVVSSWVDLAAGAKADVFLRVIGLGGDGVADPAFGRISVQFR